MFEQKGCALFFNFLLYSKLMLGTVRITFLAIFQKQSTMHFQLTIFKFQQIMGYIYSQYSAMLG